MSSEMLVLVPRDSQPQTQTLVWQHNSLAEARYSLTAREQKVLLYVVAMIEPEDDELKLYKIRVEDFARLLSLGKDDLYEELRDVVSKLKAKPLVIRNHFETGDKKPKNLLTSWFQDVVTEADGSGYIGVSISARLKPYLLQVKREFFRYQLGYAIELHSAYSLRLYQWAKRWQFTGKRLITIEELRTIIGAEELDEKGRVKKRILPQYGEFHKWALRPAVKEINEMTDLRLSYVEQKTPGTKRVEALLFRITPSSRAERLLAPLPQVMTAQKEFCFSMDEEVSRYLEEIRIRFRLSPAQMSRLRSAVGEHGVDYLKTKVELVTKMEPDNGARALLAALRDDWQPPVKIRKERRERMAIGQQLPVMSAEEDAESRRKILEECAAFRQRMKGGINQPPEMEMVG
jgi:plasmid replication initiation protein